MANYQLVMVKLSDP